MAQLVWRRRSKASLIGSTALQAAAWAVLASPAAAQLAVNARPTGGQVSAGQASIANTASKTTINQSSQNAAINWQSYSVGSGQTVQYVQPNAASVTLNRVVGSDPSQIAGHILANGQIVLVNQSGVVFAHGAQVDTAGLVVSTAGITDKNFMAGRMVFDQAGHPGAAISNAGNITVRQAGLAALVAPQVANSGTITAQLGRVVLGGAETHTLDLYGDGLVALNVTGQVTKASLGGRQVTALVTNSGTILAPGGTVVLSAAAVDGVVTNLVEAGGKIAAPSQGAQTGRVLVQGIGGGISIDGDVSATGVAAGTKGGQVVANATGAVTVGAGANVDASGESGGGVVAIGTTAARAIGGASVTPTLVAQSVTLARGAHVSANATHRGAGGRIAVLSKQTTSQFGNVAARGNNAGGWIEISGAKLNFGGLLDVGTAQGLAGTILLDPQDIQIGGTPSTSPTVTNVGTVTFASFIGNVIMKADGAVTVAGAASTGSLATSLELEAGGDIAINARLTATGALGARIPVALSAGGDITENAQGSIIASALSASASGDIKLGGSNQIGAISNFPTQALGIYTGVSTSGSISASDAIAIAGVFGENSVNLNDLVSLDVQSGGPVTSNGTVSIIVGGTTGTGANLAPNTLKVEDDIIGSNVALSTTGVGAANYAGTAFSQTAGTIEAEGVPGRTTGVPGTLSISVASGNLSIASALLTKTQPSEGQQQPPPISGATTLTAAAGNIIETAAGSILTGTLSGGSTNNGNGSLPGNANFAISASNTVSTLTAFTSSGSLSLVDQTQLDVGTITANGGIAINTVAGITLDGIITAGPVSQGIYTGALSLVASDGDIVQAATGSSLRVGTLSGSATGTAAVAGNALFSVSNGNSISIVKSFTATGSFTLESDAALDIANLSAGPTISITAPTQGTQPAGPLMLDATITADGGLSFANGRGIGVQGTAVVGSTGAGVTLESGGAIDILKGASIVGREDAATGTAITLAASGSTNFGGTLGTVHGISLDGTLTAGSPNAGTAATGYTGSIFLSDLPGNILEGPDGRMFAASLSGTTTAGQSMAGNVALASSAGNTIGTLAGFTTAGSFAFEDDTALVVQNLQAGTLSGGAYSGAATLTTAQGDITEASGSTILAGALTAQASGGVTLNVSSGNSITGIGGYAHAGDVVVTDDTGPTVNALSATGSITISGPVSGGTGILTVAGAVSAADDILLSNPNGIAAVTNSSVTSTGGVVTLTTPGAILQEGSSTIAGGTSLGSGTLLVLNAGGGTDFDPFLHTTLGTLHGILFAGTLTSGTQGTRGYAGDISLTASAGDIVEQGTGGLGADQLAGGATASGTSTGSAQFLSSAGNTIGTLNGFPVTGSFALEDDIGLLVEGQTSGGTIDIHGPTTPGSQPTGILIINGPITAPDAISLSNAKGIAVLDGIASSSGGVTLQSLHGAVFEQAGVTISSGGAGTLALSAGGTTDFTGNTLTSALGTKTGLEFDGALVAGVFSSATGAYSGSASLSSSAGDILEGGTQSSLAAGSLSLTASAGNVSLDISSGNTIGAIGGSAVRNDVTIEDDTGLALGNLAAGTTNAGGAVTAVGDIFIHGPAGGASGILVIDGNVSATGSIVLPNALGIADLSGSISTIGGSISLTTDGGFLQQAGASIQSGTSLAISAATSTNFDTYLPGQSLTTIHGISFGGTLAAGTLASGAYSGTVTLDADDGDIVQTGGSLRANLLAGHADAGSGGSPAGNASFDVSAGNTLAILNNFSVGGNFALEDDSGLRVLGQSAAGNIDIHGPHPGTQTGNLVIAGAVTATGTVTLDNASGIAIDSTLSGTAIVLSSTGTSGSITEGSTGALLAGSLSGTAHGNVNLDIAGGNSITTIGSFASATGSIALENDTSFSVGTLSAATSIELHGITTGTPAASLTITGPVSAGTTLSFTDLVGITEVTGGTIKADTLSGSITGTAAFGISSGNSVATLTGFNAGGDFVLEDDSGLIVQSLQAGGNIDIFGPSGSGTLGGILQITGSISGGGSRSFSNALGIYEATGASVTSTGGSITLVSQNGAIYQSAGSTLSALNGLSLTAGKSTDFDAYLRNQGIGTIHGIAFSGTLTAGTPGSTIFSGNVNLAAAAGDVVERSTGVLQAGNLSVTAQGDSASAGSISLASVSSLSTGNQVAGIGTASADAGFAFVDGQAVTITGGVTAGRTALTPSDLAIVAPKIDVTGTGFLSLSPPTGTAPGVVSLVADQFAFAGAVTSPGGLVALDLLTASAGNTIFSVGTLSNDTIDAASLQNIHNQRGTLAIGSLDGTLVSPGNTSSGGWTIGAGGTVSSILFDAPVDLLGAESPSALGLFSDNIITVSNGISVTSLYGVAGNASATIGTASFLGSNAIGTLGVLHSHGDLVGFLTQNANSPNNALQFQLANTAPLTMLGPVSADHGAVKIGVSGAGNTLTIGGSIASGTSTILGGDITGTDITLSAAGKISQLTGTLNAFGAPNGTIAIASAGGAVTLDGTVAGGTYARGVLAPNTLSALLIDAGGGDITEGTATILSAGTLAALASGNILLNGAANTFDVVGPLADATAGLTLSGLSAGGTSGILLKTTSGLTIADGASVLAGNGAIAVSTASGGLALGTASGATVKALDGITLIAPGAVNQTGGTIASSSGGVSLTSLADSISQTGGTISAGGDVDIVASAGSFTQLASTILGNHGVVLDIFGAISSTGNGTIASPGLAGDPTSGTVVLASATGGITFDGTIADGASVLLSAKGGDITEAATGALDAGILAASASGNIFLSGRNNQISNIGSLGATIGTLTGLPQTLTLYGLFAGGTAGIGLVDAASLTILPDSGQAVIQATSSGATLSIDEIAVSVFQSHIFTYGDLLMGQGGASTLLADGSISLSATGTIAQGLGSVSSANGGIALSSSNGDITQTGGSLVAMKGDIELQAAGSVSQSAASITSGGDVGILAGGFVTQTLASAIDAAGNIAITAGNDLGAAPFFLAGGSIAQDSSRIAAGGSVALTANATGTDTFEGNISQANGSTISAGNDATLVAAHGSFTQAQSSLLGAHGVSLAFGGDIVSTQSTIASAGIAGDASSGTITATAGGDMTLASIVSSGAAGAVLLSAQGGITQTSSDGSFTGVIATPTLAASAGGDLTLSGFNQVKSVQAVGALPGLSSGTGNIVFDDLSGLTIAPGAAVTALAGSIAIDVSAGGVALNDATLHAAGDIAINTNVSPSAIGDVIQTGGLIQSDQGNINIVAYNFSQQGAGVISAASDVTLDITPGSVAAPNSASFVGSTIQAGGNVSILGFPDASTTIVQGAAPGGAADIISAGQTLSILASGPVQQAAGDTLSGGAAVLLQGNGGLQLAGIVQAGSLSGGIYTGALSLDGAGPGIEAAGATLRAGTLAALSGGVMDLSGAGNDIALIGTVGSFTGLTALGTPNGDLTLNDTVSLEVAAPVAATGTIAFGITGGGFTEDAAAPIAATGALGITAAGPVSLAGTVTGASLSVSAGQSFTLLPGAIAIGTDFASIAAGGGISIGGSLSSGGAVSLAAGADLTELQSATINSGGASTLTAPGTITLGGDTAAAAGLGISAGQAVIEDTTGAITAATTGITANNGAITLDGTLGAGPLTIAAGTDVTIGQSGRLTAQDASITAGVGQIGIEGSVAAGGLLSLTAGTDISLGQTGSLFGNAIDMAATAGGVTVAGSVLATHGFDIAAGTDITEAAGASISGDAGVSNAALNTDAIPFVGGTLTAGGNLAIAGRVSDPILLALSAGNSLTEAAGGAITGGPAKLSANTGAITVDGLLNAAGTLTITAGAGFTQAASGVISGAPISLSAGGAIGIDGAFSSGGAVTIGAGNGFNEGAGATITGAPISIAAKSGAIGIDGAITSAGNFSLAAGTDITQGTGSLIIDTVLGAQSTSSSLTAPGTITLAGTLSAQSLVIGDLTTKATDPFTESIIWNGATLFTGSNATVKGATTSISIAAPLNPVKGALGLYMEAASFLQTGTATVSPIPGTGPSATTQLDIVGRGTARFDNLYAPSSQLLLVLEQGGSASGILNVAGLNVYYSTGINPVSPVQLSGIVGGRGGFAAAAVGFSHHLPNVNYQINSCPIESINCILLSPLIVPIVDPVNDYAEGTRRKRHQDDDALPNVGEEDY